MEVDKAKKFFRSLEAVQYYSRAANSVGLWASEELLFTRYFKKDDSLLELGCGAGRIAFGLWDLGYRNIHATDYSREMVMEAKRTAKTLDYGVTTQVADARKLTFADNAYSGAIFGFNGLMQIPKRANRQLAMKEICRVLSPGAYFVFTAHDRDAHWRKAFWKEERKRWNRGTQDPELDDFGDLYYETDHGGYMFIHSASSNELRDDLKAAGFRIEMDVLRSNLGPESERVRDFSDDTRFWVAQKPVISALEV